MNDEAMYLGAGISYWEKGDFRINPAHPALPKYVYGFLPYLASINDDVSDQEAQGYEKYWLSEPTVVYPYLRIHRDPSDVIRNIILGRIPAVIIGLLGGIAAYLLTRKLGGSQIAAGISAFLLLYYAEYAGHSILMAFDIRLAVSCAFVSLAAQKWWRRPNWKNGSLFVLSCSIATLIKIPAILFCGVTLFTLVLLTFFNQK